MENYNQDRGKESYQDMQCIWMKSNLVEYKLCDHFFDCDNCLFDKIMRNPVQTAERENGFVMETGQDILDQKINILNSLKYMKEFIYLHQGLMLKKLFNKTYYLGLSPLLFVLIDNLRSFKYRSEGLQVFPGEKLIEFSTEGTRVDINTPIYFHFCGDLTKSTEIPDLKNWIGVVEAEPTDFQTVRIAEEDFNSDRNYLVKIIKDYKKSMSIAGTTLNDGGIKVDSLSKAIGKENFKLILNRIIK